MRENSALLAFGAVLAALTLFAAPEQARAGFSLEIGANTLKSYVLAYRAQNWEPV